MNVVVFGSTGRTGRLLVDGALRRGHEVTAVARDPSRVARVAVGGERLRVLGGDVLDPLAVAEAVAAQDAVLFAVGPNGARSAPAVASQGALHVVHAMRRAAVRRLVCLSAGGTSTERDGNVPWLIDRVIKPLFLTRAFADLRHMEVVVRQSGLDWTIARPPRLLDGEARGEYRVGPGHTLAGGTRIARADVAAFMLDQLDDDANVGHAVAIAY